MNKMEDSVNMYDEQFDVTWDETDMIQVEEDEWISSVIGTDEDAIYDVLAEINWTKMTEILAMKKNSIVEELWRRAKVITAEWEKEPFSQMLSSGLHVNMLLAPMGYPFVASKEDAVSYPWIVDENQGAIMSNEEYASDIYDNDMEEIRDYIWNFVEPYYQKEYDESQS